MSDATRAEVCAAAVADAFRDDGEIFASPMGLMPMLGVRLAKLTSNPDLRDLRRRVALPRRGAAAVRQGRRGRGLDPVPQGLRRGRLRQAARDDGRHPGRPRTATRTSRRSATSRSRSDSCSAPAAPRATRSTTARRTGCRSTPRGSSSSSVDVVSGVGPTRAPGGRAGGRRFNDIHRIVTNLGRPRRRRPRRHRAAARVHPGVTVEEVQEATGFDLARADDVPDDPRARRPRSWC